ncbi:MAG: hypothetical protein E7K97_17105 [Providencia rettgeri]|nr:hypothetical protein [Providencia rettgeri]
MKRSITEEAELAAETIKTSLACIPGELEQKVTQEAENRDLLNQLLGQIQMAGALTKLTSTVEVSKLAFVKENKLYQSLNGMKDLDGRGLSGTWEEFCKLIGSSVAKVNEDINNLQFFGEEALESMSRMGIGYREMRQYRKLPADQQQALIEVAKEGDKESLMELAEELIAKQVKEKEALKADLEISRQNVAEKKEQVSQLQETNEELNNKLKHRIYHETPDQTEAELRKETNLIAHEIETFVSVRLKEAFAALAIHADEHNLPQDDFMAGLLCQIDRRVLQLREEFSLESAPTGTDRPSWLEVDENTLLGQQPVTE